MDSNTSERPAPAGRRAIHIATTLPSPPCATVLAVHHRLAQGFIVATLAASTLHANAQGGGSQVAEPSAFDQLWSHAILFKDNQNPILEEFKLRGRYQGQYWAVDDAHGSASNWEDRRTRFGFDAKMFEKKVELRLDFQSNDGIADFYDGLVDAYIRWKPQAWLSITAGKTKPLIAQYDWLESTNTQPTFERSQIFNQLGINRATALTIEGSHDALAWRTGIYTNSTPATTGGSGAWGDGEFGDFNGGLSFSMGVGYDFKKQLGVEKADVRLDWLHSERQPEDLVLNKYNDILSATCWLKQGRTTIVLEGFGASGGEGSNSNVGGFYLEPTYDLIPLKLQLVGRYSYAHSTGPLGVVGQSRYERTVATNKGRGDTYHALYGGAQYFIYGDKLKLMAGAEWSRIANITGDSYDGFTFLSGVRLSF